MDHIYLAASRISDLDPDMAESSYAPTKENREYFAEIVKQSRTASTRLGALALLAKVAKHAGVHTMSLSFSREKGGKPRFFSSGCMDFLPAFSISHSGDYVACAVSVGDKAFPADVGVDIECGRIGTECEYTKIANRFFSKQELTAFESSMRRISDREAFLKIWTAKEAISKQCGKGQPYLFDSAVNNNEISLDTYYLNGGAALMTLCRARYSRVTVLDFPPCLELHIFEGLLQG